MAEGTSVRGFQLLVTDAPWDSQYVYIACGTGFFAPPARVGFLYVEQFDASDAFDTYVIDTRILYRPGVLFLVPPADGSSSYALRLWVNWNFAGVEWAAEFYSP